MCKWCVWVWRELCCWLSFTRRSGQGCRRRDGCGDPSGRPPHERAPEVFLQHWFKLSLLTAHACLCACCLRLHCSPLGSLQEFGAQQLQVSSQTQQNPGALIQNPSQRQAPSAAEVGPERPRCGHCPRPQGCTHPVPTLNLTLNGAQDFVGFPLLDKFSVGFPLPSENQTYAPLRYTIYPFNQSECLGNTHNYQSTTDLSWSFIHCRFCYVSTTTAVKHCNNISWPLVFLVLGGGRGRGTRAELWILRGKLSTGG